MQELFGPQGPAIKAATPEQPAVVGSRNFRFDAADTTDGLPKALNQKGLHLQAGLAFSAGLSGSTRVPIAPGNGRSDFGLSAGLPTLRGTLRARLGRQPISGPRHSTDTGGLAVETKHDEKNRFDICCHT